MVRGSYNNSRWDTALKDVRLYKRIFVDLRKKAIATPHYRNSSAIYPKMTLGWALYHQEEVTKAILNGLKSESLTLDVQKHSIVVTDKSRNFYVAAWPERILIMAMARVFEMMTKGLLSQCVYSFQKGKGPRHAISDLVQFTRSWSHQSKDSKLYVLKRDVSKYGDSIPHNKLLHLLRTKTEISQNPIYENLLVQVMRCTHFKVSESDVLHNLLVGIPSGSPMVPPLENFYLAPLDDALSDLPRSFYGRYGDDFVFATPDRDLAIQAKGIIARVIESLDLTIKPEKADDYLLTHQTSPVFQLDDMFRSVRFIEWLGSSIQPEYVSIKCRKLQNMRTLITKELLSLFKRTADVSLPQTDRVLILKNGVSSILSRSYLMGLGAEFLKHDDIQIYRDIDRDMTQMIVENVRKTWGVSKSEAWRIHRSLKKPSVLMLHYKVASQKRKAKINDKSIAA